MKIKRRILSLLLVFVMLLTLMPATAIAANATELATIKVENISAQQGSTAEVAISIQNNPGVLGATLTIEFDEGLTLLDAASGEAFAALAMTKPGSFVSGCKFSWDGESIADEDILDGTILTLSFKVAEDIANYTELGVRVSYQYGNVVDSNLQPIELAISNGRIVVVDFVPGDVNSDGFINTTDIIFLRRAITGGYGVTINELAADVNDDAKFNTTDIILIRRYLAGGYGVVLVPSHGVCEHELVGTPAHDHTCTEDGNIAYWHCEKCGRYFSDANGGREITLDQTVDKAPGHLEVEDPAVPATTTSTGLTAGSHCSVCGLVIVAQEVTPILAGNTHVINYDISNGDTYLRNLLLNGRINNPNPDRYSEGNGLTLRTIAVDGYRFLGWYDGAGANATEIKKINAGSTEDVELFAHWEKIVYNVNFKADDYLNDQSTATYTVDTGLPLPTPKVSNYTFAGWSDENGHLYSDKMIPVGTTGTITLTPNWTSERNKAWTYPELGDPIIVEQDNVILFAYEIGMIENVPVATIHDFGKIEQGGVARTELAEYSSTTDVELMRSFCDYLASATTESSSWSLSNEWTDKYEINEQSANERGYTKEEAESRAKNTTNNWNVSSGYSGTTETTTLQTNQRNWENNVKVGNKQTTETGDRTKTSQAFNVGGELSWTPKSYSLGIEVEGIGVNGSTSGGLGWGLNAGYSNGREQENWNTSGKELAVDFSGKDAGQNLTTSSTSSSSSWNNSSSYGGSESIATTKTVSAAVSERISSALSIGQSYIQGGAESTTQGLSSVRTASSEYTDAVTFSTITSERHTMEWTTNNTRAGWHRWIYVNTAHVFAVVCYDMNTQAYFVYTYSVMDDSEPQPFEDYSTTGAYNDHQNGVIRFEVPYEIAEYVSERTSASQGLEVNQNTGIVQAYTGSDNCVVIPEYYHVGNNIVKITGISETAFKNNTNIVGVVLSDFVTTIPDNAFAGCTSLKSVIGKGVTSIGENAFSGCTSMEDCAVTAQIGYLGENAFAGVDGLLVTPANAQVAVAAAKSGANKVAIYLNALDEGALNGETIRTSDGMEHFEIYGYGRTYSNLAIESTSSKTILNNMDFVSTTAIPLKLNSAQVVLNTVTVSASGIALVLLADTTQLSMQGTILVETDNACAMLCKDTVLSKYNDKVSAELSVEAGKLFVCGTITGEQYLVNKNYQIIGLDVFENMLNSYTLYFNANGGECSEASRSVANSTRLGILPEPTREQFTFDGWYLEDGTTLVTENSVFSSGADVTIFAHWTPLEYKVSWSSCMGSTIKVERKTSPYANAATGTLSSGAKVYYGDTLKVTYTTKTGFTESSHGMTNITVERSYTKNDIYAVCTANEFEVSWSTGTGYSIAVSRTASQYGGAATGALQSGDPIYYGDALTIAYSAEPGYTLGGCGATEITVQGNVNADTIYASATANNYTYTILYRSSNGTDLGSATATYAFGTTNTITPPAKTGYDTPSAQSVVWDTPSNEKTITFSYMPTPVSATTKTGNVSVASSEEPGISYSAKIEYRNRTANSVQIRVIWSSTIKKGSWTVYGQNFKASVGSVSTGKVVVCPFNTWKNSSSSNRTETGTSGWITVPLSTTNATSVKLAIYYWQTNSNNLDMYNYNGTAAVDTTWTINLPAY